MVDCIIIGGGLIGMLTARELQQSGAEVLLLERGRLGGESTWAGGGILSPLYPWRYNDAVNQLADYGHKMYPGLAEALLEESGVDPQYTQSGIMVLDQDETSAAELWAEQWRINLQCLSSRREIQQTESALNQGFERALWMPEIAQMRNPRLIKALRGSLHSRAITYQEQAEVSSLNIEQDRITSVTANNQTYKADKVILAGGAWSHDVIQRYAKAPEIEPVKGQMILFKGPPGLLKTMVLSEGRYLIPRQDGRILAGSTLEHTGFDKSITDVAKQDLYQSAINLMPKLAKLEIEHHWAGLRPGTSDGVPYICPHPDIQGLYINSGHFRNGVILGAASARLMKDIVLSKNPVFSPDVYRLNPEIN